MITVLQICAIIVVLSQTFRIVGMIGSSNEYYYVPKWSYILDIFSIIIWSGMMAAWIGMTAP